MELYPQSMSHLGRCETAWQCSGRGPVEAVEHTMSHDSGAHCGDGGPVTVGVTQRKILKRSPGHVQQCHRRDGTLFPGTCGLRAMVSWVCVCLTTSRHLMAVTCPTYGSVPPLVVRHPRPVCLEGTGWKAAVSGSLEMLLQPPVSPGTAYADARDLESSDPVWSDFISRKGHLLVCPHPHHLHADSFGANHPAAVWSLAPACLSSASSYLFRPHTPVCSSLHYCAALYN